MFIGDRPLTKFANYRSGEEINESWRGCLTEIPHHVLEYMKLVDEWAIVSPLKKSSAVHH